MCQCHTCHSWYTGSMHLTLTFSPAADGEWEHILDRDRKLAEIIDPILDDIEDGTLPGGRFSNGKAVTTLRVPGRDQAYAIVWENLSDTRRVLRIGIISTT
jgi:hypothetical protein